jgi:hypothetical protein
VPPTPEAPTTTVATTAPPISGLPTTTVVIAAPEGDSSVLGETVVRPATPAAAVRAAVAYAG